MYRKFVINGLIILILISVLCFIGYLFGVKLFFIILSNLLIVMGIYYEIKSLNRKNLIKIFNQFKFKFKNVFVKNSIKETNNFNVKTELKYNAIIQNNNTTIKEVNDELYNLKKSLCELKQHIDDSLDDYSIKFKEEINSLFNDLRNDYSEFVLDNEKNKLVGIILTSIGFIIHMILLLI